MKPKKMQNISPSTILLMRQIVVGFLIVAFFAMLLTTVWYVTRLPIFTISEVLVEGGETIPHEEIKNKTKDKLTGSYLRLIPKSFAFTYPQEEIYNSLKEIHRIDKIEISRQSNDTIHINFTEYSPQALWCEEGHTEGCFFLDKFGYAFSASPQLAGGTLVRFVSIGSNPILHVQAFPTEAFVVAGELLQKFAEAHWFVDVVFVDAAGDAFLGVVGGGEFKVTLKQTATETFDNFKTIIGSQKFSHIKPGNFEYIDLRFGSKVFVNEVTQHTSSSTITNTTTATTDTTFEPAPSLPEINPVELEISTTTQ